MNEAQFACPACGSNALTPNPDGTVSCAGCGGTFEVTERTCPDCGTSNPPNAQSCRSCGRALDLVGFMLQSRLTTSKDRLAQARQQAAALKDAAEATSQERMRTLWDQEEQRLREVARAQAQQQRKDQTLLIGAIVVIAIAVISIVVYALVSSAGPGTPTATPTAMPW
jgi:hypothetical protein